MRKEMNKRSDIVRQAKILNEVVAVCMCIVGFLLLLPLFNSHAEKIVMGVLYVCVGMAKLIGFFSNDMYRLAFQFDLAVGLFALILGILILSSPEKFMLAFSATIGCFAILESALKFQIGFDARRFGMIHWQAILLSSVLLCAVGILTVISFYSDELPSGVMLGVAMIATGLENVWITAYTVRVRARKKKFSDWLMEQGDGTGRIQE